jgi:hypothetical protein
MPTQRRYIPPPPSEVREEMLPNQTSIMAKVHRSNQLIRAMEGREHTVVKVLRPRKKFVLLRFTLSFISFLYGNYW